MKFQENRKINNSRTTRALFRVNGVSIDSLEMDYKRRLSLSSSPEAQGLLRLAIYDTRLRKYMFVKKRVQAGFPKTRHKCSSSSYQRN